MSHENAIESIHGQIQKGELEPEKAVWLARKRLPWKEWFFVDFLRYWYLLGVFTLEVFAALELVRGLHIRTAPGGLLVLGVMAAVAYGAFRVYQFFWPNGALTDMRNRTRLNRRRRRIRFE